MNPYYEKLLKIANCEYKYNVVIRPGVITLGTHWGLTDRAHQLFDQLNISDQTPELKLAEFCARLTYLSFKSEQSEYRETQQYHDKMINEFQHLSPYAHSFPSVLIVGISIETALELVAHHEFQIARLTSSKTKSMNDPYYALPYDIEYEKFKSHIDAVSALRSLVTGSIESINMMQPACKATAMVMSGNIKDWHKFFLGRLSNHGVETSVVNVAKSIRDHLGVWYSSVIKSEEYYFEKSNGAKYETN